jgi:hypothetical protein
MSNGANHNTRNRTVILSEPPKDPVETRMITPPGFDRSLPVRSAFGLPVHVAASPAAPFSTPLGMT